jgi:hypothetical protein
MIDLNFQRNDYSAINDYGIRKIVITQTFNCVHSEVIRAQQYSLDTDNFIAQAILRTIVITTFEVIINVKTMRLNDLITFRFTVIILHIVYHGYYKHVRIRVISFNDYVM